jgi:Mg2+ and Co2+ transporter CorA
MGTLKSGRSPSRRDTLALIVKDAAALCSQDERALYNQELQNHLNQMAENIQRLDPNCHEKRSGEI